MTYKPSKIVIGYGSAIVAAALFGSVSTVAKPVLSMVNPLVLSSLVYLIAGFTFSPLAQQTGFKKITRKYYFLIAASALLGATIAPVMFFLGLEQTTAADTSLLANGETVFSILFALVIFKERMKPIGYLAVALILFGVFIITTNLEFNESIFRLDSGNLLVIGSTILWGLDNNIGKIITRQIDVSRLIQLKALIGGSLLLLTILLFGIPFSIHPTQIISIIVLGVFGFAISLYLYLHSIKRIGVVKASSILSLSAVFGLALAAVFLKESISAYQIIAIAIMLLGIHVMYTREKKIEVEY
ncbi:MAG: DMT family transporter [Thermoproteota archaeon]|nr:DMT family transporter [Thermoproteota archaeon]